MLLKLTLGQTDMEPETGARRGLYGVPGQLGKRICLSHPFCVTPMG